MNPDVIVVGAGIVGAACAAEFARRGLSVDVYDAGDIGAGTTAAGMGHVVVMGDSPAELALSRYSRELWLRLAPELRTRDGFVRCGTLWIASDDEEMRAADGMRDVFLTAGVRADRLDATALHEAEPALARGLAGCLRVADDCVIYAPTATRWLLERSAGAARIRVFTHAPVRAAQARAIETADGRTHAAAHVLVANGLAARSLVPGLPLAAKKGHLVITERYPGTIRHQLLELGYVKSAHATDGTSVAFNAQPRPTGQILVGSSRQVGAKTFDVEPRVLARMLSRATSFLPALAAMKAIRSWAGLRATSPDGLPMIGPVADSDARELWVAAGHEGLGVTTSLATAKLLAARMLGGDCPLDVASFDPSRFDAAHA